MSLLTSVNSGSRDLPYFIENIGPDVNGVPCIKGNATGFVRLGDPADGIVFKGELGGAANLVRGGQGVAGSMTLGNSLASPSNIVLTDNLTTINTPVLTTSTVGVTGDVVATGNVEVGGDLILTDGPAGGSISGYYFASVPVVGAGAIANPAGLTAGVYHVVYVGLGAGNENAQPAGVFVRSATTWFGNAVSFNFTAGAPNAAIGPVAGGATLNLGGAAIPVPGDVFFRKILN
jgi:hypothetical protein